MKLKFITILLIVFSVSGIFSQNTSTEAKLKYNMLKSNLKTKSYDEAIENLTWSLENSPKLTVNIYKYGGDLVKGVLKKGTPDQKEKIKTLGALLFKTRFENYPDENAAKAHSDYGDFLKKIGGDKEIVFNEYQKAFDINPSKLGIGSIISYFTTVVEKNKESNLQTVFDTYDTTLEAINVKIENYLTVIQNLEAKEAAGQTLVSREKNKLRAYKQNTKSLGLIEGKFDKIVVDLSTCEYLIPLYSEQFETNKTNEKWLTRAINRMFKKECTKDVFYATLAKQYQEVAQSPNASVFYAGVLMDKGETTKAISYFEKAVEQETNAKAKSKLLFTVANVYKKRGQTQKAVGYAKKAIAVNPNLGRAYLMIAKAYADTANKCGKSEFEKRMTYVAAKKYALKAANNDASISSYANKLVKSYKANQPSKKLIFNNELGLKSGDNYTVKCWFTETVKVP